MTIKTEALASVEQRVAVRAYELWMERGAPISDGQEDWFAARTAIEAELASASAGVKRKAKVARSQSSAPGRTRVKSEARSAQA